MAGFGTAVAIPAAILISLGFKPIFSATVSLIANSVATAFGAIGTPVLVLAKETNLDVQVLSTNVVLQLSVLMFLIPLVLLFLTDPKIKSLPKNLFLALLVGAVSLGSQYVAARYMGNFFGSFFFGIATNACARATTDLRNTKLQYFFTTSLAFTSGNNHASIRNSNADTSYDFGKSIIINTIIKSGWVDITTPKRASRCSACMSRPANS